MATQVSSTPIVVKLLSKDNYTQWSVQVKTYLKGQDLWDIIEATIEPPKPEDDEAAFKAWSKKNAMALHAIQISCQPATFVGIMEITSVKIAWDTLAKKYAPISDSDESDYLSETDSDNSCYLEILKNDYRTYAALYKAVVNGDWKAAKKFLNQQPDAVGAKIDFSGNTALHTAVRAGHVHIVEELVELMSAQNLEIKNKSDWTALTLTLNFFHGGSEEMAKCMIRKNKNLVSIAKNKRDLPVIWAIVFGHINFARYLYSVTPLETLTAENGIGGAALVIQSIYTKTFDIALDLLHRCPHLAIAVDENKRSPLMALAFMPYAFPSGNKLVFWKRWIYPCLHIQSARATNEIRVNIQQSDQVNVTNSVLAPLDQLESRLLKLFGIKQIHEMKSFHVQSSELLRLICDELSISNYEQRITCGVNNAIFGAIMEGNFEVVYEVVRTNPDLIWTRGFQCRNIFFCAVQYRQAKIFSLIYGLGVKNALTNNRDNLGNTMLHMAGMLTTSTKDSRIPYAALHMQRELQWFKEVESIVHPTVKDLRNHGNLTAQELFTRSHKNMLKEGESWMKGTSFSCTLVGALIVIIMFAAAFTVPGRNDQNTGFPIFLQHGKLFMLFIVFDALSLFSSSISVLMFLGILTSRYAEEDFLKSLPTRMIIGLSTLFFSIATMMIAFSAGLLLMVRESWMVIPIICLASVLVTLFVPMQFSLLVDMFISTYGPNIFDRKMKPWI